MNIKPLQDINPHDVINLFAPAFTSGNKGSLVTVGTGFENGQDLDYIDLTTVDQVISQAPVLPWQFRMAASGEGKGDILGMMLYDVRDENWLGVSLRYDRIRRAEAECTISGESCPVVVRGLFLVSGFVGTPDFGSGAVAADAGAGGWKVVGKGDSKSIGMFLGPVDDNGFALFRLDV